MDPFKLFGRLLVLGFKVFGFLLVFMAEASWHILHLRFDRIGDAIGETGRSIVSAFGDAFRF
jgi:hypothetical protein